jgi:hypothetical protein
MRIKLSGRFVPASVSMQPVTDEQGFGRDVDATHDLRIDLILGEVVGTPQFTIQHSDSPGIWEDVETIAATAAAGVACTFTPGSLNITATAHGLVPGQRITFNSSGQLPNSIRPADMYYVTQVHSVNVVNVAPVAVGFSGITILDAGSGTHKLIPVSFLSSRLVNNIVADQPFVPARGSFRWICTTTGGQTAQVLGQIIR